MQKLITKILEFFKLIPPVFKGNQPCYDKWGRFLGWYSRSMAVAVFIYCKDKKGRWNVLASERGKGTPDFQGYWNCTCGYLSFNETLSAAGIRETFEETGVDFSGYKNEFVGLNDEVEANKQNVTAHFRFIIANKTIDDFSFSHKWNEKDEVGEIKWIPIDEVDKYQWAFKHQDLVMKYLPK